MGDFDKGPCFDLRLRAKLYVLMSIAREDVNKVHHKSPFLIADNRESRTRV